MTCILIDIGGTNTRVAATIDATSFSEPIKFPTPEKPDIACTALQETIDTLVTDEPVTRIIVGVRGQLDDEKRQIRHDTILSAWIGFPLADTLSAVYDCPVWLENDTALAGLGEATFGAGKDFDIVVYHSISTGVGGVKIDYKEIDHGSIGFEPGHQVLDIDRTVLGEDESPTLENLVSGTAVSKRMGTPTYEIPQDDVIWDTLASYLGQGLRNSILYWSPEVIVLGGAMIVGDPKIKIEAIRQHTVSALDGFVESPFITTAKLGDISGLYGGLAYSLQHTDKER